MKKLYPLKFSPISKERVWGGESWVVSGFEDDSSVVSEGFLEKNSLYDIVETYMGELVGEEIFKYFGNEFPLLVKLLDIQDRLSLQVHPDDETAFDRHNSYGKSEAWYILESNENSIIYMGFNRDVTPTEFYKRASEGTLEEVLNIYHPKKGDFFFIESGIVHAAGGGLKIAEVQQLSDVTYRIYDWGRELNPATKREMHLDMAFDSINYAQYDPVKYFVPAGGSLSLTHNIHFSINLRDLHNELSVCVHNYNSFILYCCVDGSATIGNVSIADRECVIVPAVSDDIVITPSDSGAKLLEVYIEPMPEEPDTYINDDCDDEHCHHED